MPGLKLPESWAHNQEGAPLSLHSSPQGLQAFPRTPLLLMLSDVVLITIQWQAWAPLSPTCTVSETTLFQGLRHHTS
jgi:hypothetical protein